jgi:hypothetical protein
MHMENKMVSARVELGGYANKVLGIIKIKFGLKDKSEALNKFIELYGEAVIEKEASEEYSKKALEIADRHMKKYGHRKMRNNV